MSREIKIREIMTNPIQTIIRTKNGKKNVNQEQFFVNQKKMLCVIRKISHDLSVFKILD